MLHELRAEFTESAHNLLDDVVTHKWLGGLSLAQRDQLVDDVALVRRAVLSDDHPKIALVGRKSIPMKDFLRALLDEHACGNLEVKELLGYGRWYDYPLKNGAMGVLDLRRQDDGLCLKGLAYGRPDAIIAVAETQCVDADEIVDDLLQAVEACEELHDHTPAITVVIHRGEGREVGDFVTQQAIKKAMVKAGLPRNWADVVQLSRQGALVRSLLSQVPEETRLVLARVAADPRAKREIADALIRLCTSMNATIATVPIPVGSTVPITSIQVMMIAGIAYIGGRELNAQTLREFAGAVGINVAAGLALREVARAFAQMVPVAGSLVSASIAGGATTSLGKAAEKYYIG